MLGLFTHAMTNTNQLEIAIPDELKGVELQIIILPAVKESSLQIEFFNETELKQMCAFQPGTFVKDEEDYSKW